MDARRSEVSPDIVDTEAVRRIHEHPLANDMAAQLAETFRHWPTRRACGCCTRFRTPSYV